MLHLPEVHSSVELIALCCFDCFKGTMGWILSN